MVLWHYCDNDQLRSYARWVQRSSCFPGTYAIHRKFNWVPTYVHTLSWTCLITTEWYEDFLWAKFSWLFLHQYILFHLAQLFIRGNSAYLFLKRWNWQICHTHTRHLNFPFEPLAVSYKLFPRWNQTQLDFFSIKPNNILWFSSQKLFVSYFRKKRC